MRSVTRALGTFWTILGLFRFLSDATGIKGGAHCDGRAVFKFNLISTFQNRLQFFVNMKWKKMLKGTVHRNN